MKPYLLTLAAALAVILLWGALAGALFRFGASDHVLTNILLGVLITAASMGLGYVIGRYVFGRTK